jgi:photosystem II stability/assembly factor-like uncharacterized protein
MWRLPAAVCLLAFGLTAAGCGGDAPAAGLAAGGLGGSGGHMWVAGQQGLMASAYDGVTLVPRATPTPATLRALVCVDDQLAWAVGDGGTILATRDGGSSWSPQAAPVTGTVWGASFADAGRGYAVGEGGVVLRTTDAGATWGVLTAAAAPALRGVAAAASGGLVLAVGEGGTILRSADSGARFERVASPVTSTLTAVRLAEDELRAIAVGDGGAVIASDDGGLTWRQASTAPAALSGVAFSGGGATAVGAGGLIWRRADATTSWSAVASGTQVDLAAVKFDREAPAFGWVVGGAADGTGTGQGTVLYTNDGGAHFRPLPSPLRAGLTAVEDF